MTHHNRLIDQLYTLSMNKELLLSLFEYNILHIGNYMTVVKGHYSLKVS